MLGIHSNAAHSIPLFLVYLATLTHTYGLSARHAAGQRAAQLEDRSAAVAIASANQQRSSKADNRTEDDKDLEAARTLDADDGQGAAGRYEDDMPQSCSSSTFIPIPLATASDTIAVHASTAANTSPNNTGSNNSVGNRVAAAVVRTGRRAIHASASVCEFIMTACTSHEAPPSYLLVEVAVPCNSQWYHGLNNDGTVLQSYLQDIIDEWRAHDMHAVHAYGNETRGDQQQHRPSASNGIDRQQQFNREGHGGGCHHMSIPNVATIGPLQLQFHSFIPVSHSALHGKRSTSFERETVPALKRESPLKQQNLTESSYLEKNGNKTDSNPQRHEHHHVRALFEVIPLVSSPINSPGVSTAAGWPLRSRKPATHAAATLLRSSSLASTSAPGSTLRVTMAEPHSRQAYDWYAITVFFNILAFIYVAVYYNRMVRAAGSLSGMTMCAMMWCCVV